MSSQQHHQASTHQAAQAQTPSNSNKMSNSPRHFSRPRGPTGYFRQRPIVTGTPTLSPAQPSPSPKLSSGGAADEDVVLQEAGLVDTDFDGNEPESHFSSRYRYRFCYLNRAAKKKVLSQLRTHPTQDKKVKSLLYFLLKTNIAELLEREREHGTTSCTTTSNSTTGASTSNTSSSSSGTSRITSMGVAASISFLGGYENTSLRFLKHHNWRLAKAKSALLETLKWRVTTLPDILMRPVIEQANKRKGSEQYQKLLVGGSCTSGGTGGRGQGQEEATPSDEMPVARELFGRRVFPFLGIPFTEPTGYEGFYPLVENAEMLTDQSEQTYMLPVIPEIDENGFLPLSRQKRKPAPAVVGPLGGGNYSNRLMSDSTKQDEQQDQLLQHDDFRGGLQNATASSSIATSTSQGLRSSFHPQNLHSEETTSTTFNRGSSGRSSEFYIDDRELLKADADAFQGEPREEAPPDLMLDLEEILDGSSPPSTSNNPLYLGVAVAGNSKLASYCSGSTSSPKSSPKTEHATGRRSTCDEGDAEKSKVVDEEDFLTGSTTPSRTTSTGLLEESPALSYSPSKRPRKRSSFVACLTASGRRLSRSSSFLYNQPKKDSWAHAVEHNDDDKGAKVEVERNQRQDQEEALFDRLEVIDAGLNTTNKSVKGATEEHVVTSSTTSSPRGSYGVDSDHLSFVTASELVERSASKTRSHPTSPARSCRSREDPSRDEERPLHQDQEGTISNQEVRVELLEVPQKDQEQQQQQQETSWDNDQKTLLVNPLDQILGAGGGASDSVDQHQNNKLVEEHQRTKSTTFSTSAKQATKVTPQLVALAASGLVQEFPIATRKKLPPSAINRSSSSSGGTGLLSAASSTWFGRRSNTTSSTSCSSDQNHGAATCSSSSSAGSTTTTGSSSSSSGSGSTTATSRKMNSAGSGSSTSNNFTSSCNSLSAPSTTFSEKEIQSLLSSTCSSFGASGSFFSDLVRQRRVYLTSDGTPVECWQIRHLDFDALFNNFTHAEIEASYVHYMEAKERVCRAFGVRNCLLLLDCSNVKLSVIPGCMKHLGKFARLCFSLGELHYPDGVSCSWILCMPYFASAPLNLVFSFISQSTAESVRMSKQHVPLDLQREMGKAHADRFTSALEKPGEPSPIEVERAAAQRASTTSTQQNDNRNHSSTNRSKTLMKGADDEEERQHEERTST
ncbi:unnamed protein product [Amoebophrya sp. A25]|nr:unnamed protein product [Amoebophrya sp. A25]|eukprot:GSA25T00003273001.1